VPLAILVLVLGVYPKAVLRLQDPRLHELNAQVVKAAAKAGATTHVASREP
jgi:NADH:ubiquinone oxidoreductase subunit 4 (subunit M)